MTLLNINVHFKQFFFSLEFPFESDPDVGICVFVNHQSVLVMDDSRIRNRKSRFFPNIEKNRNLDFIRSLCVNFYRRGIHLYYHDNVATFW